MDAAGALVTGGDDRSIKVDGRDIAQDRVTETVTKMDRIIEALQSYFNSRYLSNPTRDISVNYFARTNRAGATDARFDSGGSMPNTQGAAQSMTLIGAHTALGLSTADVTDGFGQAFLIDNSSDAVRNPENATVGLQVPAYSVRIQTTLPGGAVLSRSAVGAF